MRCLFIVNVPLNALALIFLLIFDSAACQQAFLNLPLSQTDLPLDSWGRGLCDVTNLTDRTSCLWKPYCGLCWEEDLSRVYLLDCENKAPKHIYPKINVLFTLLSIYLPINIDLVSEVRGEFGWGKAVD